MFIEKEKEDTVDKQSTLYIYIWNGLTQDSIIDFPSKLLAVLGIQV